MMNAAKRSDLGWQRVLPLADGVIPLDEKPLRKLADHLRSAGHIAVAFPEHVRVISEGEDGCCDGVRMRVITTFSEALRIVRAGRPMARKTRA